MPPYPHTLGNPNHSFDPPVLIIGNKNYSSWSLRGWLMLHSFGVNFEERPIQLFHPSNIDTLQTYTPLGKVPVLLDKQHTVWDSLAIALYAEKNLIQTNIWGSRPAVAMSLTAEMHSGFTALRNEMPMNIRAKRRISPSDACLHDLARFEAIIDAAVADAGDFANSYLLGEFSVADVFFAPVMFRLNTYCQPSGIPLQTKTLAYLDKMLAHPSMQLWRQQALQETVVVPEDESGEDVPA